MKKEEAIEIAKNLARVKGWKSDFDDVVAFKMKRKFVYWKYNWHVSGSNILSRDGNVVSYFRVDIFVDDTSGKVASFKAKCGKFEIRRMGFFLRPIPILTPSEEMIEALLDTLYFPFRFIKAIFGSVVISSCCYVTQHLLPKVCCPRCKCELRTRKAKQCRHCFFSWRELNNRNHYK